MKQETNFVVICYAKHKKLQVLKLLPISAIKTCLSTWSSLHYETITICTSARYIHLLPEDAMPSDADINLKKLSVKYSVVLVTNPEKYRNIHVTYSCLDDLLFSVLNYLTTTQKTKVTYKDILTSGEN